MGIPLEPEKRKVPAENVELKESDSTESMGSKGESFLVGPEEKLEGKKDAASPVQEENRPESQKVEVTQAQESPPSEAEKNEPEETALFEEDSFLAELEEMLEKKGKPIESPAPAYQLVEPQPEVPTGPEEVKNGVGGLLSLDDEALKELGEKYSALEQLRAPQEFLEFCTFEVPAGYKELERYWVTKPYVWASILYSPERNERVYYLVEPSLTPGEKTALEILHDHLIDRLVYTGKVKDRDRAITAKVGELLKEYGIVLTSKSLKKILYYLKRNYIGYGKIDGFLRDPNIEDISCDGPNIPIFVYNRKYQSLRTNIIFTDSNELDLFVIRIAERAGKQITFGKPTIDASLPEGYRLQATLGTEVTTRGSSFSIRKYSEEPFTPIDLISYGTFSTETLAYLWLATENKKNIIIVGGTASGKTSTLNALSMFIWPDAKIVSIEDTRELALYQDNWVPSVTRPDPGERAIEMYDLLRQALRQRPEVIIVGEVRGKEALTMFQAMSTGHTCYSTMHAGSIQEMVHRLEGEPINVPHHMLATLDIVCVQLLTYYRDQRVRRNQSMVEIGGIDPATGALRTNRIFERNPLTDEFERVGESQVLREIARERGWSALELEQELKRRQQVLEYLYKNNIRRLHEVATVFRQYYFEPEKVMEQILTEKLAKG